MNETLQSISSMTPDSEPLVETAVRPFADNAEMRLSAVRLLSDLVKSNDGKTSESIERWNSVDARKRKPVWRIALFTVLAVVSAIMLMETTRDMLVYGRLYSSLTSFSGSSTVVI